LVGVLAHPGFHNVGDVLHGPRDIDRSVRVARQIQGADGIHPEAAGRQPHHPHADDWAFELPRQPG
jgi:hypothetical protein